MFFVGASLHPENLNDKIALVIFPRQKTVLGAVLSRGLLLSLVAAVAVKGE